MYQSSVPTISGLCKITDHLFLSNARAAKDIEVVSRQNITCIISAMENMNHANISGTEYIHIPVADSPLSPLSDYFDLVADKIHKVAQQCGRTLVHCNAGVSRSSALCMAYFMKHNDMTLLEAHGRVKCCRAIIRPNNGFWKQLIQYEIQLRGCPTVRMISSTIGEIPDIYEEETKNMLPI
ncbi:dual specificity protein phosphatase 18 [Aplochiton taeniatus]